MVHLHTIALFGEAEKGAFHTLFYIKTLLELYECLGHPPALSKGIPSAIQLLQYGRSLLYIRVEEEGFSLKDYYIGLKLIEKEEVNVNLAAIMMPGVAHKELMEECGLLCEKTKTLLLMTEDDFYDYLTADIAL